MGIYCFIISPLSLKRSNVAHVQQWDRTFYLLSTHEPYLPVCVQVSTSSYIVSGSHHQSSKSRKEVAQKLAGVDAGGLVSAGAGKGVWISLVQRHGLRVCHSQITGMRYTHAVVCLFHKYCIRSGCMCHCRYC